MKAKIKGLLVPEDNVPIPFFYNPIEIGDEKATDYAEVKALGYPDPHYHFISGGGRTITFNLHLNDNILQYGTLELYIKQIRQLQYPRREVGMIKSSPSTVVLIFGPLIVKGKIVNTNILRQRFGEFLNLKEVTIEITIKQSPRPTGVLGYIMI